MISLIKRNVKLYFKDKGMFLTSLITPIILLVLYGTFLSSTYRSIFEDSLSIFNVSSSLIDGCVAAQLVSSLLAVSCITVSFCSNLLMVQDKANGIRMDLDITPIKKSTIALSYSIATFISSVLINIVATFICLGYMKYMGWYLSIIDIISLFVDVILLVLFGTLLSSCITFPLSTQGQASAVGTIISAGYGFICGAYMPISQFSTAVQKVILCLPGTYGTSLLRNHCFNGIFKEMKSLNIPFELIQSLKESMDCDLTVFDHLIEVNTMYIIVIGTLMCLTVIYILLNRKGKK